MPTSAGSNLDRLLDAGVVTTGELPTPHLRVVEGLTDNEVDVLIAVWKRLGAADEWHGADPPGQGEPPHFTLFFPY